MEKDRQIPIWFFIGGILAIYGVLILGSGLVNWNHPPPEVKLTNLHADVWWGALLVIIGCLYLARFRPGKSKD